MTRLWASAVAAATLLTLAQPQTAAFPRAQDAPRVSTGEIPTPDAYFGFRMGTDRRLAPLDAVERYFALVASESDRVNVTDLGATTEGHHTVAAIISAPENIRNLERIRQTNQRLADPRTLTPEDARSLAATQKAVLVIGCSIHSSEIGANQAANELLYSLATSSDPATLEILSNVVVILIPSLNPDGDAMVVDWYNRNKGTTFEGGAMPWLYQEYAGHDINRDAFMMNLAENRNLARFFYTDWHPQVFLTMHEMTSNGPRFFVPPNVDPIDANYNPLIWRESALLGGSMAFEMQRDHRSGVLSNAMFDYYWPGYEDSAPLGHNTVCLLTEVAQVDVASPIVVGASELRAGIKGLSDYTAQINFPAPWPGGPWTLRDIVDYDLSAVHGLLRAVSAYREQIVQSFYDMGRDAVDAGRSGGPFAFIIPPDQHDPYATARFEELLLRGQVEIHHALEPFRADGDPYPAGTDVILLAQPYRAYVKTLLERQDYPVTRQAAGAPPEGPYDMAGWTLPQQMGIDVRTIARAFDPPAMSRITTPQGATIVPAAVWGEAKPAYYVVEARGNGGALAVNRLVAAGAATSWTTTGIDAGGFHYDAGSIVVPYSKPVATAVARIAKDLGLRADGVKGKIPAATRRIGGTRVALYKSWVENIDEGWTRWLLEQYEFPYTSIADADIRAGNLHSKFDAIILPSAPAEELTTGHPAGTMPPEYTGGLGPDGIDALKAFVGAGGTLIALDESADFATSVFELPLRDVAHEAGDRFFCPGSILRLDIDPSQPLGYGMSAHTAAFFAFSSAYEPVVTPPDTDGHGGAPASGGLQTVARYGNRDVLLSGWLDGENVIAGRSAVVQASVGLGHVDLLGFPVQHRAQSHATFRLLFNAIVASRP